MGFKGLTVTTITQFTGLFTRSQQTTTLNCSTSIGLTTMSLSQIRQ